MKFLSGLKFKMADFKFSPSTIVAGVVTFFIVTSLVAVISELYIGRDKRAEKALASGARLEFNLSTEEITGLILLTEDGAEAEDESNETKSEKDAEDKKTVENKLAWLNEDFIGPRMPQAFVDVLMAGVASNIKINKVKLSELSNKPIIVVILKGLGLSASTTQSAMELPKSVTFGLSPYSATINDWAEKAKKQGREVVLHIPMETKDYRLNDPGPYALLTQSSKEDNITRLNMLLGLVKGYEAVYSEKEEVFTHTLSSSKPVLQALKNKRKFLIFGGGYADFSLIQLANELEYPLLVNDFILDDDISQDSINAKFKEVEETALEKGYVVVMAHPYPITIRMLERWLPEAEERGFFIAPVSLLLGKQIVKE
ncbi:MAG: divergent polysaccharide deacetylase family protein [Rickettsiales bacterium]|nr:divergent polysaccharide deacetylase family protein [Pseudomonadota bacterium]MDA0966942.1 divergent polysaccharide deacetylase family protein [Pseudomonadota bacterium]MDG4543861.1 divergent polysaccharide deacetylase family protein [Rickettsiales bacterium]MDG4546007.1 divergent polysaccharide deacetylase family protein [Rickettsiales bacterium]MDG4548253.1 divergent polysaccharide deacetylase family protein [Rickettsiales bacterium]